MSAPAAPALSFRRRSSALPACLLLLALSLLNSFAAVAPAAELNDALARFHTGQRNQAAELLDQLVADGSRDPRVYYFRGLIRFDQGQRDEAAADFEAGARFEVSGTTRVDIARSLERVQGPARQQLEQYRRRARQQQRIDAGRHQRDKAFRLMSTRGRLAVLAGDNKTADDLLTRVIDNGSDDPRDYYFRGLARHRLERTDQAEADFREGVRLELSSPRPVNVDRALERVQGDERHALEQLRQPALNVVRREARIRHQEMVARLVRENFGIDLPTRRPGDQAATAVASRRPGELPLASTAPGQPPTPGSESATTPSAPPPGGQPSAKQDAISLAWLPADTEVVIRLRPADLWNSSLIRDYHDTEALKNLTAQMKQATGLGPDEIESVTVGIAGLNKLAEAGAKAAADPKALEGLSDALGIVVRTRSPINAQLLEDQPELWEGAEHNGTRFYRSRDKDKVPSIWLPDLDTAVIGDEARVTEAIEDGRDDTPRPEFQFVDPSRQLIIAVVPFDPISQTDQLPEKTTGSPALDELIKAARGQLLGVGLGIGIGDSVEFEIATMALDDSAAADVGRATQKLIAEGQGLWNLVRDNVPPAIAGVVDSLLRSTRGQQKKEVYAVTLRLTKQSILNLATGVQEMLPMIAGMMGGAVPGLPAGGSGGVLPGTGPVPAGAGTPPRADAGPPKADRVAENLTITPSAGPPGFNNQVGAARADILLRLDLVGPEARAAASFGYPELKSAIGGDGKPLTLSAGNVLSSPRRFVAIDRNSALEKHPDGGCRVLIPLHPEGDAPKALALVEGMVKLRIIEESSDVFIDNVASMIGKPLQHPVLQSGGYQFVMSIQPMPNNQEQKILILSWVNAPSMSAGKDAISGGGPGLNRPELVDADGKTVIAFEQTQTTSAGGRTVTQWIAPIGGAGQLPDGARLRLRNNTKVTVVDVPFKVQNIAVGNAE